jgi:hypothetical protein
MAKKKSRQLLLLLFAVIILGAGALIGKRSFSGGKVFSDFAISDTASITRIFLSDREGRTIELDRVNTGKWQLNRTHEANKVVMESLLKTLTNIEVMGMVPRSAHNTVISDLAARNTKIEIWQRVPRFKIGKLKLFHKVKPTKSYFVGGPTQDHLGTYMMLDGSDKAFITYVPGQNAFLSLRYSTRESDWRDHTVVALTIQQIASVDVEIPGRPDESYRIVKTGEKSFEVFQYYNKPVTIPLDTIRILEFMASFRGLKYEGLINDMDPERRDSIITSAPMQTITINATDGSTQTISTFRRKSPYLYDEATQKEIKWDRDRLYALINDGKDLTLCQFFVFDDVLKPFTWFRADYQPEEGPYFYEEN